MKQLFIYGWSGHGNYSNSFGWDNGMSCSMDKFPMSLKTALEADKYYGSSDSFATTYALPNPLIEGVFCSFYNEHGGSRNASGFIVASTKKDALHLLRQYEDSFAVVEYDGREAGL